AGPEQPEAARALVDGGERTVGDVAGPAALGEVVGERLPRRAPVERAVDLVGAEVENVRVVDRKVDGRLPVEAEGALAEFVARRDARGVARVAVETEVVAELEAGVDRPVRARVDGDLHAVAAEEALVGVGALTEPV